MRPEANAERPTLHVRHLRRDRRPDAAAADAGALQPAASDLLPEDFCILGVARNGMTADELRDSLMKGLKKFATREVDDEHRAASCSAACSCVEARSERSAPTLRRR